MRSLALVFLCACSHIASDSADLTDDLGDANCAALKLASLADAKTLATAGLSDDEVRQLIRLRNGKDGQPSTDDDRRFTQLSALPGSAALTAYAEQHAEYRCQEVSVQLLAINDFHGNLQPPSGSGGKIGDVEAGGAEYLATHIKTREADNPNTLVVAAGDCIGATPLLSAAFHDEPTIEALNAIGLDISSVGNHEFDEGIDELYRMQYGGKHPDAPSEGLDGDGFEGARYTYLAANVEKDGDTIFPSYTVRRFGNARVAFIGMTLEDTPSVVTAAGVAGLQFFDEVETAAKLVKEIRALGIETIVLLLHEGGATTGGINECAGISGALFEITAALDPAIDVVIAGHTNQAHICNLNGRLVTSAAHYGRLVSDIDLVIDERTGDIKSMRAENVIVTRTVDKDPELTALLDKWLALIAPLADRVVSTISVDLMKPTLPNQESELGLLIADAQLAASPGAQVALMNPGGVRADLLAGEVTYGEIFAVQPFSNNLTLFTLTGAQLQQALEEQFYDFAKASERGAKSTLLQVSASFSYQYDLGQTPGSRISNMTLNGTPIDAAASYRIVANVFLAGGGDGFPSFKAGIDRTSGGIDFDAFEAYLRAHPSLTIPTLGRATKKAPL